MIKTNDNSYTLFSDKYNEAYHSLKDGALKETLYKHIIPAFDTIKKDKIEILDICFGLGYNSFASILHSNKKLHILSPELDLELIESLEKFKYPQEFDSIKHIIKSVSKQRFYEDERVKIEVITGDAREYLKNCDKKFDIVYQDAFSPKNNPTLWTYEYFKDIKRVMRKEAILTTYSVATPIRYALYLLGFHLYTHNLTTIRNGTIASLSRLDFKEVDFENKLKRVKAFLYRDLNNV